MKTLIRTRAELLAAGRWDIDFHLPPVEITKFPERIISLVSKVAEVAKEKRDPTQTPDQEFKYVDIASIDNSTGTILNPQELLGEEAPSRARKVMRAYDVLVSTCRPTRGAICVVPIELHNQIASTAFTVLRAKPGINPYYLHYALRLESTKEQFRKWSTGSSYPAILDSDVLKTRIPVPSKNMQEAIAGHIMSAFDTRQNAIKAADIAWGRAVEEITDGLRSTDKRVSRFTPAKSTTDLETIEATLKELPPLTFDPPMRKGRQAKMTDLLRDSDGVEEAA